MRKIMFRGKFKVDFSRFYYTDEEVKYIESRMHEINSISFSGDHCTIPYNDSVLTVFERECEEYEFYQFTGLTDKNGKEIYEGDIIQDNNGIGVIMWFQTSWGVASYAHGYEGLKSYTAVDSFYINEAKEWSVIGSIHDTPELLTPNL